MEIVTAIIGGLVGGILTIAYSEIKNRRARSATRSRILFLLRDLGINTGMTRDYPDYYNRDCTSTVERLIDLILQPTEASGLKESERDAVFLAVYQARQETEFLTSVREGSLDKAESREYVAASGRRGFTAIQSARSALRDSGELLRPSDPRNLHTWRPQEPIPESDPQASVDKPKP